MALAQDTAGDRRDIPGPELGLLRDEIESGSGKNPLVRVLISFVFRVKGVTAAIDPRRLRTNDFSEVEVLGIVATAFGLEGLFAQSCWFTGNNIDWMWVSLRDIRELVVRSDYRFRGGQPCAWLVTAEGEYAMTIPHKEGLDQWEETLYNMGTCAAHARVHAWPTSGLRPPWWDMRWKEYWPGEKDENQPGSKRRASTDLEKPHPGKSSDSKPDESHSGQKIRRLESFQSEPSIGVPCTLLLQRAPWSLDVDGGMKPDPDRQLKARTTQKKLPSKR